MAKKNQVYYRHKTDGSTFKQIIIVLSDPFINKYGCEKYDNMAVEAKTYTLDYNGLKKRHSRGFCNIPDGGTYDGNDIVKPIEEVYSINLRDFLISLFEEKSFR